MYDNGMGVTSRSARYTQGGNWLGFNYTHATTLAIPLAIPLATPLAASYPGPLAASSPALASQSGSKVYAPAALALAGLVCSAPLHLRLLNMTLAGSSVALAVPCYQFLLLGCTTAAGGLLFHEFDGQVRTSR